MLTPATISTGRPTDATADRIRTDHGVEPATVVMNPASVPEREEEVWIAAVLDLSWVHSELAPYYPRIGRPSIDPGLMIRAG
jgi:hypothetical protein